MKVFCLLVSVAIAAALPHNDFVNQINRVNNMKTTWKAGNNFAEGTTLDDVKHWCGALHNPNKILPSKNLFFSCI